MYTEIPPGHWALIAHNAQDEQEKLYQDRKATKAATASREDLERNKLLAEIQKLKIENLAPRARRTVRPAASRLGNGLMPTHAKQRRRGNGLGVAALSS